MRAQLQKTYNDAIQQDYSSKLSHGSDKHGGTKHHLARTSGLQLPNHVVEYNVAYDQYQQARAALSNSDSEQEKMDLRYPAGRR